MIQVLKKWNAVLGHHTGEVKYAPRTILTNLLEGEIPPRSGKVFKCKKGKKKRQTQNPKCIPYRKRQALPLTAKACITTSWTRGPGAHPFPWVSNTEMPFVPAKHELMYWLNLAFSIRKSPALGNLDSWRQRGMPASWLRRTGQRELIADWPLGTVLPGIPAQGLCSFEGESRASVITTTKDPENTLVVAKDRMGWRERDGLGVWG